GRRASIVEADLTQRASAELLIAAATGDYGGVDVVVNNAGIYPLQPLLEIDERDWRAVIGTNLESAFFVTQAAARAMIARGQGGAIVNVTSIEAHDPAPLHAHYNAAKGGLLML